MLIWARIIAQEAVWPIENDFVVVFLCKKAIEKQGHEQQLVFLLCHLIHLFLCDFAFSLFFAVFKLV